MDQEIILLYANHKYVSLKRMRTLKREVSGVGVEYGNIV